MKVAATYPDVVKASIDYLAANLSAHESDTTVGAVLPRDWTVRSDPHLLVSTDGTPRIEHPIVAFSTIRLVAWSDAPTTSRRIVLAATAVLAAHPGGEDIVHVRPSTGPLMATDIEHHNAELAAATCTVTVRAALLV